MQVSEIMNREVRMATPNDSVRQAAQRMVAEDVGFMPVGNDDRLVGMITDRDIVARVVAEGRDDKSTIGDIMTRDVKYCFEDDDVDSVLKNMGDIQVRRMPVVNRDKQLVGIVSLADAAKSADASHTGHGLDAVTRPGGSHTQ